MFADPILGGELTLEHQRAELLQQPGSDALAPFAGGNEQMNRVVTELNWRRRFTDPIGITYTPFAQLRGDIYQMSDYVDPQSPTTRHRRHLVRPRPGAGRRDRAYPWVANTSGGSHVIEPIGQIIARQATHRAGHSAERGRPEPRVRRHEPVRGDKFSGYDRIETGTRANVGLQYTFQSN